VVALPLLLATAGAFLVIRAVVVSVIAADTVISSAGEVLAFISNAIGCASLNNQQVTS
jgi:hypothetical protein